VCEKVFGKYITQKWIDTDPADMEDEVKKLQKTAKDMKVDKKCNAYTGI
jgi:hypothetical protein